MMSRFFSVLIAAVLMCSTTFATTKTSTKHIFATDVNFVDDVTIGGDLTVTGTFSAPTILTKSYSSSSVDLGVYYMGGFYHADDAHSVLTYGGTVTRTFGTNGRAYGAHAFIVASAAGTGTGSIVVSGTSVTDAGVVTPADTETVVADVSALSTNCYHETEKKWIGQITYTLTGAASGGTVTFNYGFSKYEDFGNIDFTALGFELTGVGGATDGDINFELMHHTSTGWTYHASAFAPGNSAIASLLDDYGTAGNDIVKDMPFAYKRIPLSVAVAGSGSEGLLIRVTTTTNNAIKNMNAHIGVIK